ncbi:uncharacterized protein [Dendrobates tinctorius]|uniref:uncharacterized protein n=1 Tax=Dendrobates tinctorius TaxID=92724 RepID=UPI003CC9618E
MDSIKLPTKVAIIKVKAHGPRTSPQTVGNAFADMQAKAAALLPVEPTMVTTHSQRKQLQEALTLQEPDDLQQTEVFCRTLQDPLMTTQRMSPKEEVKQWKTDGARMDNGLWKRTNSCLPMRMYPAIATWAHGSTHRGKNQALALVQKFYWAPGISTVLSALNRACNIWQTCNPGQFQRVPPKHLAKPDYPFQRLQVDHITLPKSGRYEYCFVVVDMFSSWPEAFPVTNMTAKTTAKKLVMEVICRYGVPEVVESDQGPAFSSHVYQEVLTMLGSTVALHTPYYPQSSGKVERLNGTEGTTDQNDAGDYGSMARAPTHCTIPHSYYPYCKIWPVPIMRYCLVLGPQLQISSPSSYQKKLTMLFNMLFCLGKILLTPMF